MHLKNYKDDIEGNVVSIFAVGVLAVAMGVAAAIDYSILTSKHQKIQSAVDAATLYSAKNQGSQTFEAEAQAFLAHQIADLNLENVSASFDVQGTNVVGSLEATSDLLFAGVLSKDITNISARSVIHSVPTEVADASGPCIIVLKENDTALTLNRGAHLDAANCEVHVNSASNNAAMVNSTLDAKRACVEGDVVVTGNGSVTGLETGCSASGDILDGEIPTPSDMTCDFNTFTHTGGYMKLTPGVYCGWFSFQGSNVEIEMDPGLYVVRNGGLNFDSGTVTGHGVTFYFAENSNVTFNNGIDVDFTPPSSGDYENILMTEPAAQWSSHLNLNDANGYDFEGVIHLPKRRLTLNSGANVDSDDLMIVAEELMINNVALKTRFYGGAGESTTSGTTTSGETTFEVYIAE